MMNEVISSNHRPTLWGAANYNKPYVLVDLYPGQEEYEQVTNPFQGMGISKIQRLQNPFIYGRYKLRKEQKSLEAQVYEKRMYHPISKNDAQRVCEYNCDYRRYTQPAVGVQSNGKHVLFYKEPRIAFSQTRFTTAVIVVVKVMNSSSCFPDIMEKDNDNEYWPEYLVTLD